MPDRLHPLYLEGVRLFNAREFFDCHDVLEELWSEVLGEEKRFYQGLIQAAVALFHFETGNLGGARKLYSSARNYLTAYRPRYLGVDVEAFLSDFRRCFQDLLDAKDGYPAGVELRPERIPRLDLSPGPREPESA